MVRNVLSLHKITTQAQKTPEKLIDSAIAYILHARWVREKNSYDLGSIIAMDETPVYHDMLASTTVTEKGAKSVVMKSMGHNKNQITVLLTAIYCMGETCCLKLEKRPRY